GAIILRVTYGYTLQEGNDPFIEITNQGMALAAQLATPGTYLVDVIPALRYLPEWFLGTGFLQDAKKYCQLVMKTVLEPHQYVKEQIVGWTAIPSFLSTLLEEGVSSEEEDIIMWTSAGIYIVSTIHTFFLMMVLYSDVQAKAQAELDAVVGNDRLPSFSDCNYLPYVNRVWKEVLQWHAIVLLAVTHVATEDIHYEGYLVPKGSHILGNAGAVLHDESTYPDPDMFWPEQFLGDTPQPDPQNVCFGFGRSLMHGLQSLSLSSGYHLAKAYLFIWVAISLTVLNISKEIVDGVEITPKVK
ncbi:Cytochrome P450, partial [Tylopilus felleus]